MSVTFAASENATPAVGTIIATCVVDGENYQLLILTGTDGQPLGMAASPVHAAVVNGVSASISGGSVALLAGANVIGTASAIQSGVWTVGVNSMAGSAAGSPLFVSACITNQAGSAAGSPLFVSVTNQVSASISNAVTVAQGASGASPWGVRVLDAAGNAYGVAAGSPLFVTQNNMAGSAAGSPIFSSITNLAGSAAGSPLFVSACITNLAGSAAGSPLFVSASITNLAGSAAGSPLFIAAINLAGSAAGSPLFVTQNNMAGSAAGSPIFSSLTNLAGSAAGSPLFVSVTNQVSASISGGSVALLAGANVIGAASAIQGAPQTALANAWPVRLVSSGGSNVGVSGSPLPEAADNGVIWVGGSLLTVQNLQISASGAAASTVMIAGVGSQKIRMLSLALQSSASTAISWRSGSTGGADKIFGMFVGNLAGFDQNLMPHGYVAEWASGCAAVIFLSVAASVRGFANYVNVPG